MKQNWIKEFDEKFLEYNGSWIGKDKNGNCKDVTEKDIKNFIQSQLNKRDEAFRDFKRELRKIAGAKEGEDILDVIEDLHETRDDFYNNGFENGFKKGKFEECKEWEEKIEKLEKKPTGFEWDEYPHRRY